MDWRIRKWGSNSSIGDSFLDVLSVLLPSDPYPHLSFHQVLPRMNLTLPRAGLVRT